MKPRINNIRFEVNRNIIRLHWQMTAINGLLWWRFKTLIIRVYVEPDKISLPVSTLHHMDAANNEITYGYETSAMILTGTRTETKKAFRPAGKYSSQHGSWYEIKIDVNRENVAKDADTIAPFLEWNVETNTDFTIAVEFGHASKKGFVSDTELVRYHHNLNQIDEYLKQLKHYVQVYLDWQIISPLDIGGSSQRQKPMLNLRFSPRLAKHLKNMPFESFEKVFEQLDNRILLLGEPGAGKTITSLLLVEDAIVARENNPKAPLPFHVRIPDWIKEQLPLHEWLAKETPLSPDVVNQLLASGDCLLVLDGLDELGSERYENDEKGQQRRYDPRKRFIALVNKLSPKIQLLITCRIEDYDEIGTEVENIGGKVTLKRLQDSQIRDYLYSTESTKQLCDALKSEPDLLDVARTPLLLSLFAFAFKDLPEEIRNLKDLTQSELRDVIFEQYIQRRYDHEAEQYTLRGENPSMAFDTVFITACSYAMMDYMAQIFFGMWKTEGEFITKDKYHKAVSNIGKESFLALKDKVNKIPVDVRKFLVKLQILTSDSQVTFYHLSLRDYLAYYSLLSGIVSVCDNLNIIFLHTANNLGDYKLVRDLEEYLQSNKKTVDCDRTESEMALQALEKLGTPEALEAVRKWREENNITG
jgi:hypothetical protein